MSTIKDVAKLANVSIATVSNYINSARPVSKRKRDSIQKAIESLQYTPNYTAHNLKANVYTDIGVILPDLDNHYYVEIYNGITDSLKTTCYYVDLALSHNNPVTEQKIIETFLKKQICALIIIPSQPGNWQFYYDGFTSRHKPVVLIDRSIKGLDANFISHDYYKCIFDLTNQLSLRGYRKIALFTGSHDYTSEKNCFRGYIDALSQSGIKCRDEYAVSASFTKEASFKKALGLLSITNAGDIHREIPDCFITSSEPAASGITEALCILGYEKDYIPVITVGEDHWDLFTHSFSTVSIPRKAQKTGRLAAKIIMDQLQNPLTKENDSILLDIKFNPVTALQNIRDNISSPVFTGSAPAGQSGKDSAGSAPSSTVFYSADKKQTNAEIRILALDTPQIHIVINMLQNFEQKTGIHAKIDVLPHPELYDRILSNNSPASANAFSDSDHPASANAFSGSDHPASANALSDSDNQAEYDVVMYDIPWLPSLASENILADISEVIEDIGTDVFLPNCLNYFSEYNHHFYGIPFMYAPQILYYRKDLFENAALKRDYEKMHNFTLRPPVTLKEYNTIADFFTFHSSAVQYGIAVSAAYDECLAPEIYMRLHAYSSRLFDSSSNVCIDTDSSLKAYLNFLRSVKCAKPDYRQATDLSVAHDFLNGETAMLITYPSFLSDIPGFEEYRQNGTIGYNTIPGGRSLLGGWSFGISNASVHKNDAAIFLKWLCDEQSASYFTLLGGLSAVSSAYYNDALSTLYPWLNINYNTYPYAFPILPPQNKSGKTVSQKAVDSAVCKWIYCLLDSKIEVQDAIINTRENLEALIRQ